MHRSAPVVMMALLLVPSTASAIDLGWISGETDLTFTTARPCTLLIQAAPGQNLPPDWRLVWVADNDSLNAPLIFSSESGAIGDPAAACEIVPPADPASTASNSVGARFCSTDPGGSATARLIVNAPAGARAKLKIVAFAPLPGDSMQGTTLSSGEITLNGGFDAGYPPLVFRASSTHHLGQLNVHLVGAGLAAVHSVPIFATDSSWIYPLTVTSRSDASITAGATLAAPLPEFVVAAAGAEGGIGAAALSPDNSPPISPQSCFSNFSGSQDTTSLQPKDFAWVYGGDLWHIFYTRQYQTSNYTDRTNTRRIGHATSTDQHLSSWTVVDRSAIHVRDGRIWDNLHVWAPSIVLKGITYYMFYTGVQLDTVRVSPPPVVTTEIQRIGVATSVDLNAWTQDATPLFFNKKVSWAFQDSTQHGTASWDFRDPFVMADPEHPGRWLMYYVTIDSTLNKFVVGVAATPGTNLRTWQDKWPLRRTSAAFMSADRDESPHAFYRRGNWWLMYTSNHFDGDQITYSLNATSPVDSATLSRPDSLKAITCDEHDFPSPLNQLHATEYIRIGPNEYLAGFADDLFLGGTIKFTQIQPPGATCPSDTLKLDCPDFWTGVEPGTGAGTLEPIQLTLAGACPVRSRAPLRLVLQNRMQAHVAIYDVFGRRVRTLIDGTLPAGTTVLSWDGLAEQGSAVSSGIYFARATCADGRRVVRIPLVH